mmetsp:Transcript_5627/g.11468  ORF Transcript_5627/g.11468 Transcript_5627/m.11468 type:complete len:507 (+) Transcript_5627:142-1662(+)
MPPIAPSKTPTSPSTPTIRRRIDLSSIDKTSSKLPKPQQLSPHLCRSPSNLTSASSINSSHAETVIKSYSQNDVVHALVTHLREREKEVKRLTAQCKETNEKHQSSEAETKRLRITLGKQHKELKEHKVKILLLQQETEEQAEKVTSLSDQLASLREQKESSDREYQKELTSKDTEITSLTAQVETLTAEIADLRKQTSHAHLQKLQTRLSSLNSQLTSSHQTQDQLTTQIEELNKKLKSKEWMIKSLTDEAEDQILRENVLCSRIKGLEEKVDAYERKFQGKDVDVPMMLAKLEDAEGRSDLLEGEMGRMRKENVCLKLKLLKAKKGLLGSDNAGVEWDADPKLLDLLESLSAEESGGKGKRAIVSNRRRNSISNDVVDDDGSTASSRGNNSFEDQDDGDATLNTNVTDIILEDPFTNTTMTSPDYKSSLTRDYDDDEDDANNTVGGGGGVFDDLIQDVRIGIESIRAEGLCVSDYNMVCAATRTSNLDAAVADDAGDNYRQKKS